MLVLYVLVSVSALRLQLPGGEARARIGMILPIGGAAVALYVLYRNVIPAPAFPYNLFPYIVAGWIAIGITLAFTVPKVRRRVSEGLASG